MSISFSLFPGQFPLEGVRHCDSLDRELQVFDLDLGIFRVQSDQPGR